MLPAACQGIVGITVRAADEELHSLLAAIADPVANVAAAAERALLGSLDGSCHTPIGAYVQLRSEGRMRLAGLVARPDGSFRSSGRSTASRPTPRRPAPPWARSCARTARATCSLHIRPREGRLSRHSLIGQRPAGRYLYTRMQCESALLPWSHHRHVRRELSPAGYLART